MRVVNFDLRTWLFDLLTQEFEVTLPGKFGRPWIMQGIDLIGERPIAILEDSLDNLK